MMAGGGADLSSYYTKASVDLLIADIYNDTYAKTDNIFEI